MRASWVNFRSGAVVQGGSTLTQQLVKNFFLGSERTSSRKMKEAFMALIVERNYSKDRNSGELPQRNLSRAEGLPGNLRRLGGFSVLFLQAL